MAARQDLSGLRNLIFQSQPQTTNSNVDLQYATVVVESHDQKLVHSSPSRQQYEITRVWQSRTSIGAGARAVLPFMPPGTVVNSNLRIIGSALSEGIPAVATADAQFALRAARAGITDVRL